MKLHDVPDNTKIKVLDDIATPPGSPDIKKGDELLFRHIDGMYSCCISKDNIVHLVAWAEVEII